MAFVGTVVVVLVVGFIYWQWKMLKKYALAYDKLTVDVSGQFISINGRNISFADIDHVSIRELPQPSVVEKTLSKSAFYAYMTQAEFYLKQGEMVLCRFNSKGTLYRALKQLEPFIAVVTNIEVYKPRMQWGWVLIIALAVMIALLMK